MRVQIDEARQADSLELAVCPQHLDEPLGLRASVFVSVEGDDIIEVARARTFRQCAELLGEGFHIVVGQHLDPFLGRIGIGMKNRGVDGGRMTRSSAVRPSLTRGKLCVDETGPL